jgi:hypothetical protein
MTAEGRFDVIETRSIFAKRDIKHFRWRQASALETAGERMSSRTEMHTSSSSAADKEN